MPYLLGAIILPNPKKYTHNFVESVAKNELIFGITSKRLQRRKRQHQLDYQYLTQDQINAILSVYTPRTPVIFIVNEPGLSVGPITVLVDIMNRSFVPSGELLLENLSIGLTEV